MHAAETAGGEDADARERGEVGGRRDRRRPARAARREDRQVAHARLREVFLGDAAHALGVEPDRRNAVEHRDRRGRHTLLAQDRLELDRRLVVARARQAVADDRRLEGDDGAPGGERRGDLVGELDGGAGGGGLIGGHSIRLLACRSPPRAGSAASVGGVSPHPLPIDPIAEARRQWIAHGWADAADGMTLVTSVMRAQQLLQAKVDATLRQFDLTFARYEMLQLLSFTKDGEIPMASATARLQVHPTSVTNTVQRLERDGLLSRVRTRRTVAHPCWY